MSLEMRPDCARCGRDLPPDAANALICSLECSWCVACGDAMGNVCPNCGGALAPRPTRTGALCARYPASTERRHKA